MAILYAVVADAETGESRCGAVNIRQISPAESRSGGRSQRGGWNRWKYQTVHVKRVETVLRLAQDEARRTVQDGIRDDDVAAHREAVHEARARAEGVRCDLPVAELELLEGLTRLVTPGAEAGPGLGVDDVTISQ